MKFKKSFRVILALSAWLFVLQLSAQTVSMASVKDRNLAHTEKTASAPEAIEKTNFVVRDIFNLVYGHYREAIAVMDEAMKSGMIPPNGRILTDFTGDAYRLIFEMGFNSLADYEKALNTEFSQQGWRDWYEKFKPHVESSSREILRWVR